MITGFFLKTRNNTHSFYTDSMKKSFFFFLLAFSLHAAAQRTIKKDQIKLCLSALYISGHVLSFDITLFNRSLLGYELQYIKFFIRERHIASRTAVQEREVYPLVEIHPIEILADGNQHFALDFNQFTIPKSKELVISVKERNGTRDLALHIQGHRFLKMIRLKNEGANEYFNNQ